MNKTLNDAADKNTAAFFSLINNRVRFSLYLLKNVPAAYFSGVKIVEASPSSCTVSIPYKWFTRNPFRSTYFASLSMAAELSTGVLAMGHLYKRMPFVSLLVTGIEGKFYKKATGLSWFECNDGENMLHAIHNAVTIGEPQQVKAHSFGKNKQGEVVAEFWITWSFKVR